MLTKGGALVVAALAFVACFRTDAGLTEAGLGKPELTLDFPEETTAGATVTAELTILNPGPGDMDSLVIAFSRLGDPKLPVPIVDATRQGSEGAVTDVVPAPRAVSRDGVTYTFDGVDEGRELVVTFTLRIPPINGLAGNAILVYDGRDIERAKGVRLVTEVAG